MDREWVKARTSTDEPAVDGISSEVFGLANLEIEPNRTEALSNRKTQRELSAA
jgi:hypothetical protein